MSRRINDSRDYMAERDGQKADESFVQVPIALLDSGVGIGAIATYAAIRRRAWKVGDVFYGGIEELVELRGLERRTLSRDIAALVSVNAITKKHIGKRIPDRYTVRSYSDIVALPSKGDGTNKSLHTASDRTDMSLHIEPVMGRDVQGDETSFAANPAQNVSASSEQTPLQSFRAEEASVEEEEDVLEMSESEQKLTPGPTGAPGERKAGVDSAPASPSSDPPREDWVFVDDGGDLDFDIEIPNAKAMEDFEVSINVLVGLGWSNPAIAQRLNVSCPSPRIDGPIKTLRAVAKVAVDENRAAKLVHA